MQTCVKLQSSLIPHLHKSRVAGH